MAATSASFCHRQAYVPVAGQAVLVAEYRLIATAPSTAADRRRSGRRITEDDASVMT
jgi:hypothetical protein